jgi:dTMP kinase
MLIAVEGIDGAGKSTLCAELDRALHDRYPGFTTMHFPSYSPIIAQAIHHILSQPGECPDYALQALFAAARLSCCDFIQTLPGPVVIDRYKYSSYVYGISSGLSEPWCRVLESPMPDADLVLLLDLPPAVAAARRAHKDRLETDTELQRSVRASYLTLAAGNNTWHVLDGQQGVAALARHATNVIIEALSAGAIKDGAPK